MVKKDDYIVLFVEGDTDREFYHELLNYYYCSFNPIPRGFKIINIKGISRFETKVATKLKYEVLAKVDASNIKVFCCYDSDVFELAQKPPTNWKIVEKRVKELGIKHFQKIMAIQMIEDWFLKDLKGLCKFLGIEVPKKLNGTSGLDKIKLLFKKGKKPKIYQKGSYTHKFISNLDISTIRTALKTDLKTLENALGIK